MAFLSAGNNAGRILIPAFKSAGARLHTVVSANGVGSVHTGRKHGFIQASTDATATQAVPALDTAVVATWHNLHAAQVIAALRTGKHVFCEKPLCPTLEELAGIEAEAEKRQSQHLMIGFNRRFAPHAVKAKQLLSSVTEPKNQVMTVNAGAIPPAHWTQDKAVGGGRILGEGCHLVDLFRHLTDAPIARAHAVALGRHPAP